MALDMASRSGDLLRQMMPSGNVRLINEVHDNLQQLVHRVTEMKVPPVALHKAEAADSLSIIPETMPESPPTAAPEAPAVAPPAASPRAPVTALSPAVPEVSAPPMAPPALVTPIPVNPVPVPKEVPDYLTNTPPSWPEGEEELK